MLRWVLATGLACSPMVALGAPSLQQGAAVAQAACAGCHAVGAEGGSPNPASPPFRELNSRFPVADLIGAIAQGAPTGHPEMPRFHLQIDQMLDLVAFVSSVQAPVAEPSSVAAGRLVAEGECGGCHAVGEGASPNPASPPFRELSARLGAGIRRALQQGMIADNPTPLEEGRGPAHPAMPSVRLDPDELANLTAYLDSLR